MAMDFGEGGGLEVQMEGPFGGLSGGSTAKLTTIELSASAWKGAKSPYFQVVDMPEVSVNSKVDLQLSVEQLELIQKKRVAFIAENDAGVVTIYAMGDRPNMDYTLQATVLEVIA